MEGRPVTIRLLDPPLHEFLPTAEEDIRALANDMGLTYEYVKSTIESLHENNPMMGFRGCRLPVKYPEIAEMQTRAIIEAAINVKARVRLRHRSRDHDPADLRVQGAQVRHPPS